MRRNVFKFVSLLLVLLFLAGCSNAPASPAPASPAAPQDTEAPVEATKTLAPLVVANTPEVKPTTYKESMLPFDQLIPGDRIVILQNTINFGREGFYTPETKPVTQEIEIAGEKVNAYPISYAINFLKNELAGNLKVFHQDGTETEVSVEEFSGLFIVIDFTSDQPPLLVNPQTGLEITDFIYAVTDQGEVIYSVVSGSFHNTHELLIKLGWDVDKTYRCVATDKFYFPVGAAELGTGEIRGTLSGAVNASFPDLKIASGKMNDLIYIEKMD